MYWTKRPRVPNDVRLPDGSFPPVSLTLAHQGKNSALVATATTVLTSPCRNGSGSSGVGGGSRPGTRPATYFLI